MHRELAPAGIDIVTVCLDVEGADGARPFLDAVDGITHVALVDRNHRLDEVFGIVNVPMAVAIDEDLQIVHPAEPAWPAPLDDAGPALEMPAELPERMAAMFSAASKISADRDHFLEGLRDWAANGAASSFVLGADAVLAGSVERTRDQSAAAAHFELGEHLHRLGDRDGAVEHFRESHRLDPANWTYKRQAWELASRVEGPLARMWQGPLPGAEQDWPYDGEWITDIEAAGPENYYRPPVRG